jgi:hypothetical protein
VTDRIDELQRLHEHVAKTRAAAIKDESRLAAFAYARTNLADAAEKHLPALLRVARAARRCLDGSEVDGWHTPLREVDVVEMREALGELDGPADRIG